MKVKISFEIDYEQPENKYDYDDIIKEIRNYFENDIIIPQTLKIYWNELSQIKITDDYKSPEKE